MKKVLIFVWAVLALCAPARAQLDTSLTTHLTHTFYVLDLKDCYQQVQTFLQQEKVDVLKLQENSDRVYIDFSLNPQQYGLYQKESAKWSSISRREIESKNYFEEIAEYERKIEFNRISLQDYMQFLEKLDPQSENYLGLWREKRKFEDEINRLNNEVVRLRNSNRSFTIHVEIAQERDPTEDAYFSWVNMPGVEYSYFKIENPMTGLSSEIYQGIFLKYLFTRGKSYGLVGALKNLQNTNDSTINELFIFALGQDFYSRYFGRGTRKSLNLYSSFNLGYMLGSSDSRKFESWYMSAYIGVELLKTKYVLIDNKLGYTIPFEQNRYFRGLDYRFAVNFIF